MKINEQMFSLIGYSPWTNIFSFWQTTLITVSVKCSWIAISIIFFPDNLSTFNLWASISECPTNKALAGWHHLHMEHPSHDGFVQLPGQMPDIMSCSSNLLRCRRVRSPRLPVCVLCSRSVSLLSLSCRPLPLSHAEPRRWGCSAVTLTSSSVSRALSTPGPCY